MGACCSKQEEERVRLTSPKARYGAPQARQPTWIATGIVSLRETEAKVRSSSLHGMASLCPDRTRPCKCEAVHALCKPSGLTPTERA